MLVVQTLKDTVCMWVECLCYDAALHWECATSDTSARRNQLSSRWGNTCQMRLPKTHHKPNCSFTNHEPWVDKRGVNYDPPVDERGVNYEPWVDAWSANPWQLKRIVCTNPKQQLLCFWQPLMTSGLHTLTHSQVELVPDHAQVTVTPLTSILQ